MKINIEKPLTGWIKLDISVKGQTFSDTLSYTPEDFTYKLIEVLNLVSLSKGQFVLNGYSEPIIYDFIFESKDNEVVFEISTKEKGNFKCIFRQIEPKNKLLITFFRALSKMKSTINKEEYKSNWHYEFPEAKFQKLRTFLNQSKE